MCFALMRICSGSSTKAITTDTVTFDYVVSSEIPIMCLMHIQSFDTVADRVTFDYVIT